MKKLLAILGACTLTASGVGNVIACGDNSTTNDISGMTLKDKFAISNVSYATVAAAKVALANQFIADNKSNLGDASKDDLDVTMNDKNGNVMVDSLWSTLANDDTFNVVFKAIDNNKNLSGTSKVLSVKIDVYAWIDISKMTLNDFVIDNQANERKNLSVAKTALIQAFYNSNKVVLGSASIADLTVASIKDSTGKNIIDDAEWQSLKSDDTFNITFEAANNDKLLTGVSIKSTIKVGKVTIIDISDFFLQNFKINNNIITLFSDAKTKLIQAFLDANSSKMGSASITDIAIASMKDGSGKNITDDAEWQGLQPRTAFTITFKAVDNDLIIKGMAKVSTITINAANISRASFNAIEAEGGDVIALRMDSKVSAVQNNDFVITNESNSMSTPDYTVINAVVDPTDAATVFVVIASGNDQANLQISYMKATPVAIGKFISHSLESANFADDNKSVTLTFKDSVNNFIFSASDFKMKATPADQVKITSVAAVDGKTVTLNLEQVTSKAQYTFAFKGDNPTTPIRINATANEVKPILISAVWGNRKNVDIVITLDKEGTQTIKKNEVAISSDKEQLDNLYFDVLGTPTASSITVSLIEPLTSGSVFVGSDIIFGTFWSPDILEVHYVA